MLEFGFPIGYTAPYPPAAYQENHPLATQHPQDVAAYIAKELKHSAILGPFTSHPLHCPRTNPMMTRPKKDSSDRRVIVEWERLPPLQGQPQQSLQAAQYRPTRLAFPHVSLRGPVLPGHLHPLRPSTWCFNLPEDHQLRQSLRPHH